MTGGNQAGRDPAPEDDLDTQEMDHRAALQRVCAELAVLFGEETVEQARQVDSADLNLTDEMVKSISEGVRRLKELKQDPRAQRQLVETLSPGEGIVLCLWIMDMDLLEKIQDRSYLEDRV